MSRLVAFQSRNILFSCVCSSRSFAFILAAGKAPRKGDACAWYIGRLDGPCPLLVLALEDGDGVVVAMAVTFWGCQTVGKPNHVAEALGGLIACQTDA